MSALLKSTPTLSGALAIFDDPHVRVKVVTVTTYVPLLAFLHLIFIHGASIWLVATCFVMTAANIGGCMSLLLHRFFAHRAFETGRNTQLAFGWLSCLAYQQGPLWWASKHRRHHSKCDTKEDPHSWSIQGYYHAWIGWTMDPKEGNIEEEYLGSLARFPELRTVDRLWFVPPYGLTWGLWKFAALHPAYPLMTMLMCRLICLHFNCVYHPPPGEELSEFLSGRPCKSIDCVRFLADIVGESHHDDHHTHPSRAHRPGLDWAYYGGLAPLLKLGIIWGPKGEGPDRRKQH